LFLYELHFTKALVDHVEAGQYSKSVRRRRRRCYFCTNKIYI